MKTTKFFLFLVSVLFSIVSCSNDDNNSNVNPKLEGTWRLVERYVSPGTGGVHFTKVTSSKMLVFKNNLQITSNGSLCDNDIEAINPSIGSYVITSESSDLIISGTITSSKCDLKDSPLKITYRLEDSYLYVYYPSIEGSIAKYAKAE